MLCTVISYKTEFSRKQKVILFYCTLVLDQAKWIEFVIFNIIAQQSRIPLYSILLRSNILKTFMIFFPPGFLLGFKNIIC